MPPKRKRTVADDISELLAPTPKSEVDLDAFDTFEGAGPRLDESEDEADLGPAARFAPEKGLLSKGDITLDDEEYTGRAVSRSQWEKQNALAAMDEDEEGEDEDEDEDEDEGEGEDGEYGFETATDGVGSEGDEEEEEGDEDFDDDDDGEFAEDDEEDDLEKEYAELQEEEARMVGEMRKKQDQDREKGDAARAQRAIWDGVVEARILLQGLLTKANSLPRPHVHTAVTAQEPDVADSLQDISASASSTLGSLLALQSSLLAQNGSVREAAEAAGQAAALERAADASASEAPVSVDDWELLEERHRAIMPFVTSACDTWQRKSTLASGNASKIQLQALNQSISSQVGAALRAPDRLLARSRLSVHAAPHRPCDPAAPARPDPAPPSNGASTVAPLLEDAADEETYDDGEFYMQILKEFIDSEGNANGASGTGSKTKRRKVVDRKASKGRRIRFEAHPKIVNFMAPIMRPLPPIAKQLLSSNLFAGS